MLNIIFIFFIKANRHCNAVAGGANEWRITGDCWRNGRASHDFPFRLY